MTTFSAYQVEKEGDTMSAQIVTRDTEALPPHNTLIEVLYSCLLYTSPSPRDERQSRMPSSA